MVRPERPDQDGDRRIRRAGLSRAGDRPDGRAYGDDVGGGEGAGPSGRSGAATGTLAGWIEWLRVHDASNRRIGTVGWCFGGGWSLTASVATPDEATVIYYGRVAWTPDDLRRLKGLVLGHFATKDRFIDAAIVAAWEDGMETAGKAYATCWYDADHGFANPASARYDTADARLAWDRTLAFFGGHL